LVVALLAAVGAFAAPGASAATTTIGGTNLAAGDVNLDGLGQNIPVFQGDAAAGYVLSAPAAGTIVSWSFRTGGAPLNSTFVLRLLRPAAGGAWTGAGTSDPVAVTNAGDVVLGPFPANLPVNAGDRIALQATDGQNVPIVVGVGGHDGIRYFSGPLADGATAPLAPGATDDNGQVVPIQATIDLTPTPTPPVNQTRPSVIGVPKLAQTVSCNPGTWTGGATFTYRWEQDDGVSRQTLGSGPSLLVSDLLPGSLIRCIVTASNAAGSATATSDPVTVQATVPVLALGVRLLRHSPPTRPHITPDVGLGGTNLCTPGVWLHYPTRYTYRWLSSPNPSGVGKGFRAVGAGKTIRILAKMEQRYLVCRVTASNAAGANFAFSNVYFVRQAAPKALGPIQVRVSLPGIASGSRIDPPNSKSQPLRSKQFGFSCISPDFTRSPAISISWEVTSSVAGFFPYDGFFIGQGLAIDARGKPVVIDGTPIAAVPHLDGTVRCIVTARLAHAQTVIVSSPIYVFEI
jgi:hypothetical protein